MMKRKVLEVSLPLLVCLVCVGLVTAAVAAPRGGVPILVNVKAAPDLVVKKVTLVDSWGVGGSPAMVEVLLAVTVKNIGNKESGPCNVVLCVTSNAFAAPAANQPFLATCGLVPKLQPNASCDVSMALFLPESQQCGMCIVAVDPPIQDKPYGQVSEWPLLSLTLASGWGGNRKVGEHNNAFGFVFDMTNVTKPFSWRNPVVD